MFKLKQKVAKVIRISTFTPTVTFGYTVVKVLKNKVVAKDDNNDESEKLEFLMTGNAVENWIPGCMSQIMTIEKAKAQLKTGELALDGGEEVP